MLTYIMNICLIYDSLARMMLSMEAVIVLGFFGLLAVLAPRFGADSRNLR